MVGVDMTIEEAKAGGWYVKKVRVYPDDAVSYRGYQLFDSEGVISDSTQAYETEAQAWRFITKFWNKKYKTWREYHADNPLPGGRIFVPQPYDMDDNGDDGES